MHFLFDVTLQQDVGADDGDHVIQFNGLFGRGRGRRWRRSLGRGLLGAGRRRDKNHREEDRDARAVVHQKACPMLKKKLKCPAWPTQGGFSEEFAQELDWTVEVEP